MILFRLRQKKINARRKLTSALTVALISGLLVSIPAPANAAECIPTSTTVGADTVLTFATVYLAATACLLEEVKGSSCDNFTLIVGLE